MLAAAALLYLYRAEFVIRRTTQEPGGVGPVAGNAGAASPDASSLAFFDQPRALPEILFADGEGRSLSLLDFRNRPVLLNIWATWCVPCREEMPALDRLQAKFGPSRLLVVPLSIDRQGLPAVKKFYEELGVTSLGIYIDQSGQASSDLNIVGLPTTMIIDRYGREIGRKSGPAEWDSSEVIALLRAHLGLSASE